MNRDLNKQSLNSLCASLAYAMGIDAPETAAYVFFEYTNGKWRLDTWNDTGALE